MKLTPWFDWIFHTDLLHNIFSFFGGLFYWCFWAVTRNRWNGNRGLVFSLVGDVFLHLSFPDHLAENADFDSHRQLLEILPGKRNKMMSLINVIDRSLRTSKIEQTSNRKKNRFFCSWSSTMKRKPEVRNDIGTRNPIKKNMENMLSWFRGFQGKKIEHATRREGRSPKRKVKGRIIKYSRWLKGGEQKRRNWIHENRLRFRWTTRERGK